MQIIFRSSEGRTNSPVHMPPIAERYFIYYTKSILKIKSVRCREGKYSNHDKIYLDHYIESIVNQLKLIVTIVFFLVSISRLTATWRRTDVKGRHENFRAGSPLACSLFTKTGAKQNKT